jgi:hypothetical protein
MPTYEAETVRFQDLQPEVTGGARSWYARAQNFVVCYSTLEAGASVSVEPCENEYVAGVVEGAFDFEAGRETGSVGADAVVIVPPGASRITARGASVLFRVFAPPSADLIAKCGNRDAYPTPRDNVAPFELWPMPADGYKLRVYKYASMPPNARRIFRSRNIMLNWAGHPGGAARDLKRFTPHSHDDFEQGSLELWGAYVHHLRYPWEADYTAWRPDQRMAITPPGLTIMPARVIHTSQGTEEWNCLADVFAPPRFDFSLAGYVYNAAEYPMPELSEAQKAAAGRSE